MVYNRRHPTEQYRVSLKLTSGALRMFFLSPGSKNAHPFWTLEDKITTFLQVRRRHIGFLLLWLLLLFLLFLLLLLFLFFCCESIDVVAVVFFCENIETFSRLYNASTRKSDPR